MSVQLMELEVTVMTASFVLVDEVGVEPTLFLMSRIYSPLRYQFRSSTHINNSGYTPTASVRYIDALTYYVSMLRFYTTQCRGPRIITTHEK